MHRVLKFLRHNSEPQHAAGQLKTAALRESQGNPSHLRPRGLGCVWGQSRWLSSRLWMGASGPAPPSLGLPLLHSPEANGGSDTGTARDPLKAETGLLPLRKGAQWGRGREKAGRAMMAVGCPPDAQAPIVESSPFGPQMHTSCLERGCLLLLASARIGHRADFHTSWSPPFLGPPFPFGLRSLQDRECVLSGGDVSSGDGTRAPTGLEEAKSRSPPPSRALPSPSRPHPGTQAGLSGLGRPKIRS